MDHIYVCENCGRLGPIDAFQDECRPGWTHGRLISVRALPDQTVALTLAYNGDALLGGEV